MKRSKRTGLSVLVFVILMGIMAVSVNAASVHRSLQVKYGVKVVYNNKVMAGTEAPFISEGRTYVPLRMLINTFGDKTISWDAVNQKVIITDAENSLRYQLAEKESQIEDLQSENDDLQSEIDDLENEIEDLEDEIDDLEDGNSSMDLSDLEDYLVDYYEDDITDIVLSGDEDDIRVTIKVDESDWDSFSAYEKENFLQDICDDIWYDFEDADITGTVKEGSSILQTFEVSAGDDVSIE